MSTPQLLLALLGLLAVHALGIVVYIACAAPVWMPGHEIDLPPLEVQR